MTAKRAVTILHKLGHVYDYIWGEGASNSLLKSHFGAGRSLRVTLFPSENDGRMSPQNSRGRCIEAAARGTPALTRTAALPLRDFDGQFLGSTSATRRTIPEEAAHEAEKIRRTFSCCIADGVGAEFAIPVQLWVRSGQPAGVQGDVEL